MGLKGPQFDNSIEQADIARRWSQTDQLIQAGLRKPEKEAKNKQSIGDVMQKALSVTDLVSLALIQTMPQAALAWTGACFTSQASPLFYWHSKLNSNDLLAAVHMIPMTKKMVIKQASLPSRLTYIVLFS